MHSIPTQSINSDNIPINITQLYLCKNYTHDLMDVNIETEINLHYLNRNLPVNRIINIFCFEYEYIDLFDLITQKNEYSICAENEYNDVVGNFRIIKLTLIPNILSQQKIKSTKNSNHI